MTHLDATTMLLDMYVRYREHYSGKDYSGAVALAIAALGRWAPDESCQKSVADESADAVKLFKLMKKNWTHTLGELNELCDFLVSNGVTFKEDA